MMTHKHHEIFIEIFQNQLNHRMRAPAATEGESKLFLLNGVPINFNTQYNSHFIELYFISIFF